MGGRAKLYGISSQPLTAPTPHYRYSRPSKRLSINLIEAIEANWLIVDKPHDDGSSADVSYSSNDTTSQTVSFVMYADDLTLFDTSAGRLQVLVDRLASYANKKGWLLTSRNVRWWCSRHQECTVYVHRLNSTGKQFQTSSVSSFGVCG
jgi:hypothetical protein